MKRSEFIAMLAPGLEKLPGERSEAEWREAVAGPQAKEERLALRAALEEGLRTQVLTEEDVRTHNVLLSNLALELERLFADEKKSLADLRKMMRQGPRVGSEAVKRRGVPKAHGSRLPARCLPPCRRRATSIA